MFCEECGKELPANARFCVSCGVGIGVAQARFSEAGRKLHPDAVRLLNQNLSPSESVEVIIEGAWDARIIGTKTRCFVYKRGWMSGVMFGSKLISWDYLNLNGVQIETGPVNGVVALQGPGIAAKDVSYWNTKADGPLASPSAITIDKELYEQAQKGVAVLRRLIANVQQSKSGAGPSIDIPGQLRKLAELRDQGILTAEEFEKKKKELLTGCRPNPTLSPLPLQPQVVTGLVFLPTLVPVLYPLVRRSMGIERNL